MLKRRNLYIHIRVHLNYPRKTSLARHVPKIQSQEKQFPTVPFQSPLAENREAKHQKRIPRQIRKALIFFPRCRTTTLPTISRVEWFPLGFSAFDSPSTATFLSLSLSLPLSSSPILAGQSGGPLSSPRRSLAVHPPPSPPRSSFNRLAHGPEAASKELSPYSPPQLLALIFHPRRHHSAHPSLSSSIHHLPSNPRGVTLRA